MSRSTYDVKTTYVGTGSLDTYTFNFKITSAAQLLVIEVNDSGVETQRVRGTDVTYLSSVTFDEENGGGTVVLAANLTASYSLILLLAEDDPKQEYQFRNKTSFTLKKFENALDEISGATQRLAYRGKQTFRIHDLDDEEAIDLQLPPGFASNPNTVPIINATADGLEFGPTANEIQNAQGYAVAASASADLAADWAVKVDGDVDGSEYSSKAYALGGTGVTGVAGKGASKEWATKTASTVDGTEFSSKEYAQGSQASTGGSSKNWAQQTGADVTGAAANSRSAKSWAQEAITGATLGGSSKDWAQNTSVPVDGSTGYSAKEHAQGTQTRGAAGGGSAKDWANYTGGTVDDTEYSAKYYALTVTPETPVTESISAAGDISHSSNFYQYRRVVGNAGAVTASNTPFGTTTTNFVDGMEIMLVGTSDTNTVRLDFNDAASGALLNGVAILGRGKTLTLVYDATLARFVEKSRNF